MNSFIIRPLGRIAAVRDVPFSLLATRLSIPLTHPWNRMQLSSEQRALLRDTFESAVHFSANAYALKGNHPIRSHIWFLGGWREYIVLKACTPWYVGWIVPDGDGGEICEVSRIPIDGKVRMLLGPDEAIFFAIEVKTGIQIHLDMVGFGRIGKGDKYRDVMLL
jgi:hypothetical protein